MSENQQLTPAVVDALIKRERLAMVGRLLKGLVHNLSGAMQMVRLPLDLIQLGGTAATSDLGNKLPALQQGVERLNEELNLLSAKSMESLKGRSETFDLWELVRDQLAFWRSDMYFKHEVDLSLVLPPGPALIKADYLDVALAFNALVANAVEALRRANAQGLVVAGQKGEAGPELRVWDQGGGPSPEMQATMFDAFVTDKGAAHDGLGLYLARQALARWGGRLDWSPGEQGGFFLRIAK